MKGKPLGSEGPQVTLHLPLLFFLSPLPLSTVRFKSLTATSGMPLHPPKMAMVLIAPGPAHRKRTRTAVCVGMTNHWAHVIGL